MAGDQERAGRWLRSTGSGEWWLLEAVVQPGLILCRNEAQTRGNLLGVYYKRLGEDAGGGYDYAWQQLNGKWDYAYSERSAALRLVEGEGPKKWPAHT